MRRHLLLLLVSAALASAACGKLGELTLDTTATVSVGFHVRALAPLPGQPLAVYIGESSQAEVWGYSLYNASRMVVAAAAREVLWDRDLVFDVTLYHFAPGRPWRLEAWGDGAVWFYVVSEAPERTYTSLRFVVPRDRPEARETAYVKISMVPQLPLCASVFTDDSGACGCVPFGGRNAVRVAGPGSWMALEVDGRRPGDVVKAFGVASKTPNPWIYSDTVSVDGQPMGVSVKTDAGSGRLGDWVPFGSYVAVEGELVPSSWGRVDFMAPKAMPLYVSRVVSVGDVARCMPPSCLFVSVAGNSTWMGAGWTWRGTLASLAVKSGAYLRPYVALWPMGLAPNGGPVGVLGPAVSVYMPQGSAWGFRPMVLWRLEGGGVFGSGWVRSFATAMRAVDGLGNLLDYEGLVDVGKLAYSLPEGYGTGVLTAPEVYVAVDGEAEHVTTAWYSAPDPCVMDGAAAGCVRLQHVYTKVNGSQVGYAMVGPKGGGQWPWRSLALVGWLVPANPQGGGFTDLMSMALGDPYLLLHHVYRLVGWAFNTATGDFDMQAVAQYPGPHRVSLVSWVGREGNTTTADGRPLNMSSLGAGGRFYDYVWSGVDGPEYPGGWADAMPLGVASLPQLSNGEAGPWVLQLIPATACPSSICGQLDVELWGPFPSPVPALALPGRGYAFALIYLGRGEETGVKLYVESGYVTGPDGLWRPVEGGWTPGGGGFLIAEVPRRVWRFGDAVFVGYGWWREARPLGACQALRVGRVGLYSTPQWRGPVGIAVEDDLGRRYSFSFFVSDGVTLDIAATTEVPESLTTPQLNVTLRLSVDGVPLFHSLTAFGEGGREYRGVCIPAGGLSQLAVSGDFGGFAELIAHVEFAMTPLRPLFELVGGDAVRIEVPEDAVGHVRGYALYLRRNGTWAKAAVLWGSRVLLNASRIWPWDPLLVVPLVERSLTARDGDVVALYSPQPAVLFRWWGSGWPVPGTPSGPWSP